jgi:cytochrome P450
MGGITTALPAILDEPTHAAYRKLVSNAYTMSALQNYEPQMDRVTDQWLAVFDRFASSGGPVNISQWSHYCQCASNTHASAHRY